LSAATGDSFVFIIFGLGLGWRHTGVAGVTTRMSDRNCDYDLKRLHHSVVKKKRVEKNIKLGRPSPNRIQMANPWNCRKFNSQKPSKRQTKRNI